MSVDLMTMLSAIWPIMVAIVGLLLAVFRRPALGQRTFLLTVAGCGLIVLGGLFGLVLPAMPGTAGFVAEAYVRMLRQLMGMIGLAFVVAAVFIDRKHTDSGP